MRARGGWRATMLAVVGGVLAVGGEVRPQEGEAPPGAGAEVLPLSLDQAVRLGFANNLRIEAQQVARDIAAEDVRMAEAEFDPLLSASAFGQEQKTPPSQPLFVNGFFLPSSQSDTDLVNASVTFGQKILTGGSYSIATGFSRFFSVSSGGKSGPTYSPFLNLSFRQPLLRGIGPAYNLAPARSARLAELMADLGTRQTALEVVLQVHQAYWALATAHENLAVSRESLRLARELLEINERKLEQGLLAPIDVLQAKSQVAAGEESLIVAENDVEDAEDSLRRLLFRFEEDRVWDVRIEVTEPVPQEEPVERAWRDELAVARAHRPDLAQKQREVEGIELDLERARNELLPTLDLGGLLQSDASGRRYEVAARDLFPAEAFTWNLSLSFNYPLGNRLAEANVRKQEMRKRKALLEMRDLDATAAQEVRRAVREFNSVARRVASARAAREYAWEKYESERKRFEVGQSTNFEVLQFQNDWLDAKRTELRADFDFALARKNLEKAQGILLDPLLRGAAEPATLAPGGASPAAAGASAGR